MHGCMQDLCKPVDLFSMYQVDRILNILMISVAEQHARQGLAARIIGWSIDTGRRLGIPLAATEAVNHYAGRCFLKLGFSLVNEIDYDTYVYEGCTPLANNGVHRKAQLLVHRLL